MTDADSGQTGLREVARDAARQRLADLALDLFDERGFDEVRIEQIAERAGISARSVHRYFSTKEDIVVAPFEGIGGLVTEALAARPQGEPVMSSLREAFSAVAGAQPERERDRVVMRLLATTPSLRARNAEKHLVWADRLVPVVAERLDGGDDVRLRAHVLVHAAIAAFQAALLAWADDPAGRSVTELVMVAFADLDHPGGRQERTGRASR